jgi:glutamate formiminotransferase/glutamate formiminotransferase/formiminotetrahydrofolate cyclodeaminase
VAGGAPDVAEDSKVLLAVPNVSEGRDERVMEQVERAFAPALFLDIHADPDHGRAAYTLAAEQGDLAEGLVSGAAAVVENVDLSRHEGLHPHVGALDVMPVVYMSEEERGPACAEVLAAAGRIGAELDLPVILYGELAALPEHRERAWLRQGGWRRLAERIESGEVRPDFGPARAHPTAGVVLAAARPPLIAFNLDLRTRDVKVAKRAAAAIRESGGGLPGVRAIGLFLESRGCAQVSTNIHDYRVTPLRMVVEEVRRHAPIADAELIGLAPAAAFQRFPDDVPIRNFSPERHLLENALRSLV